MCEELGSGWDKIVSSCELAQLPAPKIELYEDSTRVVLFSEIPFSAISIEDKLWACYLHACIRQVEGEQLTNSSLRERFGLKDSSAGSISRLIKEAVSMKLIKPLDSSTAPRYMKYIPIWAWFNLLATCLKRLMIEVSEKFLLIIDGNSMNLAEASKRLYILLTCLQFAVRLHDGKSYHCWAPAPI